MLVSYFKKIFNTVLLLAIYHLLILFSLSTCIYELNCTKLEIGINQIFGSLSLCMSELRGALKQHPSDSSCASIKYCSNPEQPWSSEFNKRIWASQLGLICRKNYWTDSSELEVATLPKTETLTQPWQCPFRFQTLYNPTVASKINGTLANKTIEKSLFQMSSIAK